jgi:aryl-alcohol dehydrogenase-like predicted oxidoreductase
MRYRTFGKLGWQVSEIGFGAWQLGGQWGPQSDEESIAALHRAIELGVNFIDTAQAYGEGRSERVIAQVLKSHRGHRVFVATKIPPKMPGEWPPSPYDRIEDRYPGEYLRERVEQSLRDLGQDTLDLVQLHSWTRAWNGNPLALDVLKKLKKEGKIRGYGISTPEHDQNSLIEVMRNDWLDSVQVIYNIFDQEAQAEFFYAAAQSNTAVIVRVPFDESALTGKLTKDKTFAPEDFRNKYFAGDRLSRAVERAERVRQEIGSAEPDMPTAAIKFCLKPKMVSTVIPGMRNVQQAEANCRVSDLPPMSDDLERRLRAHNWRKAFWYAGK